MATRGNEKFIRRQKEVERQKAQAEKREKRAARKNDKGQAGDEDIAAIQAALDAGLQPGAPTGPGAGGDEEQKEQGEGEK